MKLLFTNGRVVDPANKVDSVNDILVENGKVARVAPKIRVSGKKKSNLRVIDVRGKVVMPGAIDMHAHLREPGYEEKETIYSGTRAAASGGITSICCMPNTYPVIDNQTAVEFIMLKAQKEGAVNVFPVGAITKNLSGEELTEIAELKRAGVVAISDDGNAVANSRIMHLALKYAKMFSLPVISHCEDVNLSKSGVMNAGYTATLLGLRGIPSEAEEIMVIRDIILARSAEAHLHVTHVSCRESVKFIREAKRQNIHVTCDTAPHYFTLTEEAVKEYAYNTNTKVNPPLRTTEDVKAIKEGLKDGTIDCIASDHAPHTQEEKAKDYESAPFGIIGLETLLPLIFTELVHPKILSLQEAVAKVTVNPARVLNLPNKGRLSVGADADITIVDLEKEFIYEKVVSKSKNTPFLGRKFRGCVVMTIVGGKIVFQDGKLLL
jgi:dihydroorotase